MLGSDRVEYTKIYIREMGMYIEQEGRLIKYF